MFGKGEIPLSALWGQCKASGPIKRHAGTKVELTGESHGMSPPGPGSQLVGKDTELIRSFGSRKKPLETPKPGPLR